VEAVAQYEGYLDEDEQLQNGGLNKIMNHVGDAFHSLSARSDNLVKRTTSFGSNLIPKVPNYETMATTIDNVANKIAGSFGSIKESASTSLTKLSSNFNSLVNPQAAYHPHSKNAGEAEYHFTIDDEDEVKGHHSLRRDDKDNKKRMKKNTGSPQQSGPSPPSSAAGSYSSSPNASFPVPASPPMKPQLQSDLLTSVTSSSTSFQSSLLMSEDSSLSASIREDPNRRPLDRFILLQEASGCWLLTDQFAKMIGQEVAKIRDAFKVNESGEWMAAVIATALALAYLEIAFSDSFDEWMLLHEKAMRWITKELQKNNSDLKAEDIMAKASKFLV